MKPHQKDTKLRAYALGELPPEESVEVERAIAADPTLRAALLETEEMSQGLIDALGGKKERLQPRQRDAIRRVVHEAARQGKAESLSSHRQARRTWIASLTAAAVIIGGIFLLTFFQKPAGKEGAKPVTINNDPVKEGRLEGPSEQGNVIRLPLKAFGKSLSEITDAVRGEKRMPTKGEVSIPELLNAFPLKANGSVALWHGCMLGVEIMPSPWKPSGSLVIVEIQGAKDGARKLSVEYHAEEAVVIDHRLIGYASRKSDSKLNPPSEVEANSRMLLVIEVESRDLRLGSLHGSVGGREVSPLPLVREPEREPSDDARFAALVCAFGLWLRGEGGGTIDEEVMLALAREVASASMVADRYDFLNLIDEATKLPEK
jgi:hypothetical protein